MSNRAPNTTVEPVGDKGRPAVGSKSSPVKPQAGGDGRAPVTHGVKPGGTTNYVKGSNEGSGGAKSIPANVSAVAGAKAPARQPSCGKSSSGRGPKMNIKKA